MSNPVSGNNQFVNTGGRLSLVLAILTLSFAGFASHADAAEGESTAGSRSALEEVVVTAQKRTENIQDVPFSVSALSGDRLEKFHMEDLQDINGTIPNVQFAQTTNVGLNLAPTIRGIGLTTNPDPYAGTEVAVVIDGVIQGTRLIGLADQYDIERIEVLRGPQGTLFGANTLGGVVNVTTRQPTGELGAYGRVSVGNFDEMSGTVGVNFPIVEGVLAGKVTLFHRDREGFYTNLFDGQDLMWVDTTKGRAYLSWTPTPTFDATLKVGIQRIRNGADAVPNHSLPGQVFFRQGISRSGQDVDFHVYTDSPHINEADDETATLTANWSSPIGEIVSITNYSEYDGYNIQDVDALTEFLLNAGRVLESNQFSQEVRTTIRPRDNLEVLVGAYYRDLECSINTITLVPFAAPGIFTEQLVTGDKTFIGIFAQSYLEVTPRLTVGLGLRYSHTDIGLRSENRTWFTSDLHPFHYTRNLASGTLLASFDEQDDETWSEPSGKISVDYELARDVSVYAYYARGFKAGGFNGRITDPRDIGPFEPEFIDSYEIGLKSELLDNLLRVNVATFYNDWSDMQVPQSVFRGNQASSTILNAAEATIKGVEAQVEYLPTERLLLEASAGYLKAEYDKFTDAGVDFSGRQTPYAPEWTASARMSYSFPIGDGEATASLQYAHIDERWGSFTQFESERMDSVGLVDINLAWAPWDDRWSIELWAKNLLDEEYISSALNVPPLFSMASYGAPRRFGVDLRFEL